ncbi:MAG: hypothetical protein NTX27_18035 [Verrucomicrobia bacterium]|nr:hypothetical protein [Verrucomicrobiota bacterium]
MGATPPRLPLSRTKARTCAVLNLLATPGLGSLLGRKRVEGVFQLLLAVAGFLLIVAWFLTTLFRFYQLMDLHANVPPNSPAWLGLWGAALFLVAWVWSLFTSISIWRGAGPA